MAKLRILSALVGTLLCIPSVATNAPDAAAMRVNYMAQLGLYPLHCSLRDTQTKRLESCTSKEGASKTAFADRDCQNVYDDSPLYSTCRTTAMPPEATLKCADRDARMAYLSAYTAFSTKPASLPSQDWNTIQSRTKEIIAWLGGYKSCYTGTAPASTITSAAVAGGWGPQWSQSLRPNEPVGTAADALISGNFYSGFWPMQCFERDRSTKALTSCSSKFKDLAPEIAWSESDCSYIRYSTPLYTRCVTTVEDRRSLPCNKAESMKNAAQTCDAKVAEIAEVYGKSTAISRCDVLKLWLNNVSKGCASNVTASPPPATATATSSSIPVITQTVVPQQAAGSSSIPVITQTVVPQQAVTTGPNAVKTTNSSISSQQTSVNTNSNGQNTAGATKPTSNPPPSTPSGTSSAPPPAPPGSAPPPASGQSTLVTQAAPPSPAPPPANGNRGAQPNPLPAPAGALPGYGGRVKRDKNAAEWMDKPIFTALSSASSVSNTAAEAKTDTKASAPPPPPPPPTPNTESGQRDDTKKDGGAANQAAGGKEWGVYYW